MRKSVAVAMGVILAAGMVLTAVLPYVKMEFASSAHYTEQDTREYEYYTPDLLKKYQKFQKIMSLIIAISVVRRRLYLVYSSTAQPIPARFATT